MQSKKFTTEFAGKTLTAEFSNLAEQANGSVLVRYADTVLLATAVMSPEERTNLDYFPLTVDYEERLYAAGKIPGGFIRREGRPSEEATLTSRLTDRPLRPLLPKTWRREIQVIITVLSADHENDPDTLAILGGSCVLGMSSVPFEGPVGACHVGYIDGQFVVNPTLPEMEKSAIDLVVASTKKAVVMIEAGAKEVSEEIAAQAIRFAHQAKSQLHAFQLAAAQGVVEGGTRSDPGIFASSRHHRPGDERQHQQRVVPGALHGARGEDTPRHRGHPA